MFAGWGSWVAHFRWPVLTVALVAVLSTGLWGLGVFGQLTEGGYNDPSSESSRTAAIVQQALGTQAGDVVAIYTPTAGKIGDAPLTKAIKARLAALPAADVKATSSYWQSKSAVHAAKDKSSAVAVITLVGPDDGAKLDQYREIKDSFAVPGATVQLAGAVPLNDASSTRSTSDLGTAELISLPITLALLLFIFGSLVAAALPVLVGGLAVLGSLGILHVVASNTEVNSFAVNVASLLGLGMAIDYGLFMVGRFREELAEGHTPAEAVRRTVGTAGRTVVFSATLLMIALSGLLLFPQGFLNSLAYGGLSAVALALLLSLTLLPAMLAVLGRRVDKLPIRLPRRRAAGPAGSVWAKVASRVLRRPVLVALPILAILLLLASPALSVHFGDSDERILPADDPGRIAVETLKADYPQFANNGVQIVLRGTDDTAAFAAAARAVPGIDQIGPTVKTDQGAILTATLKDTDPYSQSARDAVDAIRALPVPPGAELLVGGTTARNQDSLHATAAKLPLMIGLLAGATLILMFLAFGSVLLPIKAVLMSALSLSATGGILVWIFDQGHLAGLLNVTPAPLEVGIVVLMAAVVFGLSTDYEVFLLSRMVEARARGASTAEAVTTGLARTGRVISAAALLLIVVTGAFALSAVTTMRFVGVGMIVALLLDATVVRMLLVPAVLGLIGDAAWWAPGPLRRFQQRAGFSEYAGAAAAGPVGKHAAPDDTVVFRALPAAPTRPSKSPVPELLFRDEDRRPAFALPPGPADDTLVFPAYADGTDKLSTVRIELEPARADAVAAETVDAELIDGTGREDLEATGILIREPAPEIADAEVVPEPAAVSSAGSVSASEAAASEPAAFEAAASETAAADKLDPTSETAFEIATSDETPETTTPVAEWATASETVTPGPAAETTTGDAVGEAFATISARPDSETVVAGEPGPISPADETSEAASVADHVAAPDRVTAETATDESLVDTGTGRGVTIEADTVTEGPESESESDTPLFAGAGTSSYAALFPELFTPATEPAVEPHPDWSAPVTDDAFFAPSAPDPFLYRTEVPTSEDERYVALTPADDQPELDHAPTADLDDPQAADLPSGPEPTPAPVSEPTPLVASSSEDSAPPLAASSADATSPLAASQSVEAVSSLGPEQPAEFAPSPAAEPTPPFVPSPAAEAAPPRVFEAPAFEPSLVPVFNPAPATAFEPEPAPASGPPSRTESAPLREPARALEAAPAIQPAEPAVPFRPAIEQAPHREPAPHREQTPMFGPAPAFGGAATESAVPAPRRPADLSEVAAAWRRVIEHRAPITERPADLAGYVGQNQRPAEPGPRTSRPADLSGYAAARPADPGEVTGGWRPAIEGREARPADLGQYGQTWQPVEAWRRPEHLGEQPAPPRRRPASLADHVPAPRRRPEETPGEGPTRDLSEYGEQEESHPRA